MCDYLAACPPPLVKHVYFSQSPKGSKPSEGDHSPQYSTSPSCGIPNTLYDPEPWGGRGAEIDVVVLDDGAVDVEPAASVVDVRGGPALTGIRKPICDRSSTPIKCTALFATPYTLYVLRDSEFF